jgi:hypothetical protein
VRKVFFFSFKTAVAAQFFFRENKHTKYEGLPTVCSLSFLLRYCFSRAPLNSVLTLTSAIVGSREELMDKIYPAALASGYLWYSYGDGMIVL